ncbi:GntR family transcriptional regulator [Phenylobacterium sp.]|jgi:DNA-binding transcriptional MocR family regulator|uniref:GntR family transcriptional regulator n=1 Tax=Phenylobacterium sp. TaxID=1871053 RepID=UPI002F405F62
MAADRVEPFQVALSNLRDRLREGVLAPGERIAAVDVAAALRLSATPVREALSRLAGEGLLEDRRGQGFFVRTLTAGDIADLYRLSLAQLAIAHDPHRPALGPAAPGAREDPLPLTDPIREVERLFADWVAATGSRALSAAHRATQIQLGPVRRAEAGLLDDLAAEARELQGLRLREPGGAWAVTVRRFHLRRISLADRLAALLDRGRRAPEL